MGVPKLEEDYVVGGFHSRPPIYYGVDNGMKGAIVGLDCDGEVKTSLMMPIDTKGKRNQYDLHAIKYLVNEMSCNGAKMVVLEKAQPMPMNGSIATFSMGYCFGLWKAFLTAYSVPYTVVAPKTWQKVMFENIGGETTKDKSEQVAKIRYPDEDWRATERSRKVSDGKTDALCMALYSMEVLT